MNKQTRTHLGLLGVMQSELNAWSQHYYVTLQIATGEQRTLEMSPDEYSRMQGTLDSMPNNADEWIYVFASVDEQ